MPAARFALRVTVRGDDAVLRALRALPPTADREVKDGAQRVARDLGNWTRAAGRAESRQAARASRTVRTLRDKTPVVVAGPHPLLLGSEFGASRRFGWYSKHRYINSAPRQFKPHRGSASYWFFRTLEHHHSDITRRWQQIADAVVHRWAA